jgi:hypothetical protein
MLFILIGKILETIGALLIAWVGARAMYIEVRIAAPVRREPKGDSALDVPPKSDLEIVEERLDKINDIRNRLFGYWEAIYAGIGTVLIFFGCAFYLFGLLSERQS